MLKKLLGESPSTQVLTDERNTLLSAMEKATQTGEDQSPVEVDGQLYVVKDPKRAGREIEPITSHH